MDICFFYFQVLINHQNNKHSFFLQKIDKIPPVCNATSSPVSCGSDPCKCSQTNVYITADIWDEGDGLDEITAPNTPTNSLLLNGFNKGLVKKVGIIRATLM